MLTKVLVGIVLSGALVVAGDATYKQFGCCHRGADVAAPSGCCSSTLTPAPSSEGSNCCEPLSACCLLAAKVKADRSQPQGDAAYTYCTRTNTIYQGCCSEFVDGEYRCRITGEVSKESCCVPFE